MPHQTALSKGKGKAVVNFQPDPFNESVMKAKRLMRVSSVKKVRSTVDEIAES